MLLLNLLTGPITAAQNWPSVMDNHSVPGAVECLERIRSSVSASEFGYKIQALAGHILLRLGYRIQAINQSGHPDIVAMRGGAEYRFEIEAEFGPPRPRKLTDADLESLACVQSGAGFFALAISQPRPYWVLVPVERLLGRELPCPNILLEALSDKAVSAEWTHQHICLLQDACRQIRLTSFRSLSQLAREGHNL